ncbi:MAG: zinc ribbon domain-containing protein [Clostridia bacterium]|nr:zinc ribbon domain-containing protein [Clostridia bacterium]
MGFMDKVNTISQKVGDGVVDTYKVIADKSGKMFEGAKIKMAISDKEEEVNNMYTEIGKAVYETYKKGEDVDKDLTKECKKIDKMNNELAEMNKEYLASKDLRECQKCSEIIPLTSAYCEKCGEKQTPLKFKKKEEKKEAENVKVERVCPTCGTICSSDAKFCNKCGYKF